MMAHSEHQAPLWRLLQAVALALQSIRGGVSGTAVLGAVAVDIRPGVQALLFSVLRSLGRAQALRAMIVNRCPSAATDALLCSALALIWKEQDTPYEAFTLVNQTVEAAKRSAATRPQASFINACLRRFLRERKALLAGTASNPLAIWNYPAWWVTRLQHDWPDDWQSILHASDQHAPMTLRVNTRRISVEDYLQTLKTAGVNATVAGKWGVTLEKARPVQAIAGFAQGLVSVQDAGAQLAAELLVTGLPSTRRLRVLDACAAPGGKTAHLLELAECDVLAIDIDAGRCQRILETFQRLGLSARVLAADAANVTTWWDSQPFDAILLDAPCSGSGIVRRHPDVRWLRRDSDIAQLAAVQAQLLRALWVLLKPGGRLLYCTCSVFKAEGLDQVQTFLANNTEANLLPSPGHLLPQDPANSQAVPDNLSCDHDGFFYALLEKRVA
jgi:16S rRNA (cytosine967-C5)-methyltransferase